LGVPKLTDVKEYASIVALAWSMGLTAWAKLYTWKEKRRRERERIQAQIIDVAVKKRLEQEQEEKKQILTGILHVSNGKYAALQRKLEVAEAKNVELQVKMLEQQTEISVLNKLLEIRRKERKEKSESSGGT